MSDPVRLHHSGADALRTGGAWPTAGPETRSIGPHSSNPQPDEVTLSRFHRMLSSTVRDQRIEGLRFHVSRGAYSVPTAEISRGMIAEHLTLA